MAAPATDPRVGIGVLAGIFGIVGVLGLAIGLATSTSSATGLFVMVSGAVLLGAAGVMYAISAAVSARRFDRQYDKAAS